MFRTAVDTKYQPNTSTPITVKAGGDLQTALNTVQPGQDIILEVGAAWPGNFNIPAKSGSAPIHIRPANLTPENVRVLASSGFPRLISPNASPALTLGAGVRNVRPVNIDFGLADNATINYGIVKVGDSAIIQLLDLPQSIILDRCLVHGNSVGDCARGVELNGVSCAVIDSRIANIHWNGADAQAICMWNGAGPFKIDNDFLEASGENFMAGGADPRVDGLVPADIQFTRNHCFKPLTWQPSHSTYAGKKWSVKNLFELKNARYVLIEGNRFENNWVDGQDGTAILFTVRNQEGTAPWSEVSNVLFKNNEVINSPNGCYVLGTDYLHPSQSTVNLKVINNLFDKIGSRWFVLSATTDGLNIEQNTAINGGNILTITGTPQKNFTFKRNICFHNEYGIIGTDKGPGRATIDYFLPNSTITENVLIKTPDWAKAAYPGNLFAPDLASIGFDSQFKPSGTYATYGADVDAIKLAQRSDTPPPPPPPPVEDDLRVRILAAAEAEYLKIQADKKLGSTSKKWALAGARRVINAIKLVN